MIWNQILTLLFPARCTICDRVLSYGKEGICEDCEEQLEYLLGLMEEMEENQ